MVIQVCVVCLTIAIVWFISVLIPTVLQIKRTAKEVEVTAKSIYSLSEEAKENIGQMNKTVTDLSNRFKEDVQKIESIISSVKGVSDIIVNSISPPLIKVISAISGIGSGLRFISRLGK